MQNLQLVLYQIQREKSLFLYLTPHVLSKKKILLKVVASALSVPPDHGCAQEERVEAKLEQDLSKVVDKRTYLIRWAFSLPPLYEFLWMMGVLVNPSSNSLPIIHPFNDRASFGIMTGIGLFSDSIHSICSAFAPLELIFSLILLFLHFHCLFYLCSPILL